VTNYIYMAIYTYMVNAGWSDSDTARIHLVRL